MKSTPLQLDLHEIPQVVSLVESWAMERMNAAAFCFGNCGHQTGVKLKVLGKGRGTYEVTWRVEHSDALKRTFADLQEAVERGAEGIAALLAAKTTGHHIISRSRKGTGFDYYLGPPGKLSGLPFQDNKGRLEVSGIMDGTDTQITTRVKSKKQQTGRSSGTKMPAVVIVTEFTRPVSHVTEGQ